MYNRNTLMYWCKRRIFAWAKGTNQLPIHICACSLLECLLWIGLRPELMCILAKIYTTLDGGKDEEVNKPLLLVEYVAVSIPTRREDSTSQLTQQIRYWESNIHSRNVPSTQKVVCQQTDESDCTIHNDIFHCPRSRSSLSVGPLDGTSNNSTE